MSDLAAQNIINFGRLAANVGSTLLRQEGAKQLTTAQRQVSAQHFDFFRSLAADTDPSNYDKRLEAELHSQYGIISGEITNPYARRDFTSFLEGQKEADRQRMVTLQGRNTVLFGGQELVTSLDAVLSHGVTPGDSLDEYRTKSLEQIKSLTTLNRDNGVITPDEAARLKREYSQELLFGMSRDMAFGALGFLLDSGETTEDTLDVLERAIRSEGEDFETAVAGASPRLAELAAAYENIALTPAEEESLVEDLRREASARRERRIRQKKERAVVNETQLTELLYSPEWRELAADEYKLIKNIYAGDQEKINEWIETYKQKEDKQRIADEKQSEEITASELLRQYDIEVEGLYDLGTTPEDVDTVRDRILADKGLPDTERDPMLATLRSIKADIASDPDAEHLRDLAIYDRSISEEADKLRAGNGSTDRLIALRNKINADPEMIADESERTSDEGKIDSLLDRMVEEVTKSQKRMAAELAIWTVFADTRSNWLDVMEVVKGHAATEAITARDALFWTAQKDVRAERLNDIGAVATMTSITEGFSSRMRSSATTDDEKLRLIEDYASALTQYEELLNSTGYREASRSERVEKMEDFRVEMLKPLTAQGVFNRLSRGEVGAATYQTFQDTSVPSETAFEDISTEWKNELAEKYPDSPFATGAFNRWAEPLKGKTGLFLNMQKPGCNLQRSGNYQSLIRREPVWRHSRPQLRNGFSGCDSLVAIGRNLTPAL